MTIHQLRYLGGGPTSRNIHPQLHPCIYEKYKYKKKKYLKQSSVIFWLHTYFVIIQWIFKIFNFLSLSTHFKKKNQKNPQLKSSYFHFKKVHVLLHTFFCESIPTSVNSSWHFLLLKTAFAHSAEPYRNFRHRWMACGSGHTGLHGLSLDWTVMSTMKGPILCSEG